MVNEDVRERIILSGNMRVSPRKNYGKMVAYTYTGETRTDYCFAFTKGMFYYLVKMKIAGYSNHVTIDDFGDRTIISNNFLRKYFKLKP